MAVAVGRKGKCVLPRVIGHSECCGPQTERAAQPCPGKRLPADRHLRQIPRFVPHTLAEPVGGGVLYLLRRKAKAQQGGIDLLGTVGDSRFIPRRVSVPRRGSPLQIRHRLRPDILACLGSSGADAVVAGRSGRTVPAQHRPRCSLRQCGKSAIAAVERIAPARLQHLSIGPACTAGAAAVERCAVQAQGIAVGGHHLGQNRILWPVGRHLTGGCADEKRLHADGTRLAVILNKYRRSRIKTALCRHGGGLRCSGGLRGGGRQLTANSRWPCQRQRRKGRGKGQQSQQRRTAECFFQGACPPCNLRRGAVQ